MYMDDNYSSAQLGEMDGFFKKIGRAFKKVAAPIAGIATGIVAGPAAGMAVGRGVAQITKGRSSGGGTVPTAAQAVQTTAPVPTASPQQSGSSDFFDKLLALKMLEQDKQAQQPQFTPPFLPQSSAPVVVSSPAPAPITAPQPSTPPWLIPAAIGGLGLILLMDRRK